MYDANRCRLEHDGVCWHVPAEEAGALGAWFARHWTDASRGREHVVKADAAGHVAIVDGLVLKVYRRRAGLAGWLAGYFRSRACRAFRTGQRLFAAGLQVPQPVAWAARRRWGSVRCEYLVTREAVDARLLMHWLAGTGTEPVLREAIVGRLGSLLGGFHRAGFTNRDFKDGNILVSRSGGAVVVHAIDMDGVRPTVRIGTRQFQRDVLPLINSLALFAWDTPALLRCLLAAYNEASGMAFGEDALPCPRDTVDAGMPGWSCRRRLVRLTGMGAREIAIHTPMGQEAWRRWGHCFWQGRLSALTAVRSSPEAEVHRGVVDDAGQGYFFKRFLMRSSADRWKHLVRGSRGMRAWRGGDLAARHGLHVPRAVCVVEERVHGMVRGSGLVTEAVADAVGLDTLLAIGAPVSTSARRALIAALGRDVARWHAAGLVHGDMRHGNVLCVGEPSQARFYWLDNERTRRCARRHEQARNLVQLNMLHPRALSRTDRMRFWKAYTAARGLATDDASRLLRHILSWSRRRWRERGWGA